MSSKLINKKSTKLIKIREEYHRLLKIAAAEQSMTIRSLLEGYIADILKDKTSGN